MDHPLPYRFRSQGFSPLSGFLADLSLQPCCVLLPFLGFFLLQSFPFTEIAHPSRDRWLPCSYQPNYQDKILEDLSLLVSPTPGPRSDCLVPPRTMGLLSTGYILLPVIPGTRTPNMPVESASPASKFLSSCESVRTSGMSPPTGGRSSLGLRLPLEFSPPGPRVLDPIQMNLDLCSTPRLHRSTRIQKT
jgi:hypothetical protein